MHEWFQEWYATILKLLAGAAVALSGKQGYKWLVTRKKDLAEIHKITSDTEFALIDKAKEVAKELVEANRQAAAAEVSKGKTQLDLQAAEDSLRQLSRRLDRMQKSVLAAGRILVECFELMKARGIDTRALEEQVKNIHTE